MILSLYIATTHENEYQTFHQFIVWPQGTNPTLNGFEHTQAKTES